MALGRPIEARGDHFTETAHLHIGDLLGTFVDEKDHQADFRIVADDTFGNRLEHRRLACLGGRHDHCSLTLAQWAEQIDHPVGVIGLPAHRAVARQDELLVGVHRAQAIEVWSPSRILGGTSVYEVQMGKGRTLAIFGAPTYGAGKLITGPQTELVNDLRADVDVILRRSVPRLWASNEAGATTQDLENT